MVDIHLLKNLEDMDATYGGEEMYKMFGPTLFTWAMTDSSRMYMFTSNLKQTLTLLEPDVARMQTSFENTIGKYNRAYEKLDGVWEVKRIIPKFAKLSSSDPIDIKNQIVTLVLYNKKNDYYHMVEKPVVEDLTEKFGYAYNNDLIDSLTEGSILNNPILYKSTAYDKNMNYRYGKNANVYYSTSTNTIEDAIEIRKGWADTVKSIESDVVQVTVNNNDVLLNIYGDDNTYKPFPDIGEMVEGSIVCATRQINKQRLLFDFQRNAMRDISDTDLDYHVTKNSEIYDINVYYNGDEPFPDNIFYKQLKGYYLDNCEYAKNIYDAATEIKQSGSKYSPNVPFLRSKYKHFNNPEYKWKNKDKAFSNLVVEFKVKAVIPLDLGSKMAGRCGNKGVISKIIQTPDEEYNGVAEKVLDSLDDGTMTDEERMSLRAKIKFVDDDRMPYYMQGDRKVYADVMVNSSGAIRRLNPIQLIETEFNFIAEQVRYKITQTDSIDEKIDLIFRLMDCVNNDQSCFFRTLYGSYDTSRLVNGVNIRLIAPEAKADFIRDIEVNGFYIVRPPHKPLVFDDIVRLYETFPDIKPVDIYIDAFGVKHRKVIRKGIIGQQYMIILKHNSNKNFSARSTFRVNRSNLPVKDTAKKTNRSSYARTPVKLSEIYNLLASVSSRDLAEWNVFMRSSAIGRKSLDRILSSSGNPLHLKKLKIQDNFNNANAEILAAKLKTMGLRIRFSPYKEGLLQVHANDIIPIHYGDYTIYDLPSTREMYSDLFDLFNIKLKEFIMAESYIGEKHDICWDQVFNDETIKEKYEISDDTKISLRACTKGRYASLKEEINTVKKKISTVTQYLPSDTAPKKRGRKSNAEKQRLEQLRLEEEKLSKLQEDVIEYLTDPDTDIIEELFPNKEEVNNINIDEDSATIDTFSIEEELNL